MKDHLTTLRVLHAGGVTRYHTTPAVPPQTLAEHQWGVAVLYQYLTTGEDPTVALYHDVAEAYTGDVPFTAKREVPELKQLLDRLEEDFRTDVGLAEEALRPGDGVQIWYRPSPVLKLADYLEGLAYCCRYRYIAEARTVGRNFLGALLEWPHQAIFPDEHYRASTMWEYLEKELHRV